MGQKIEPPYIFSPGRCLFCRGTDGTFQSEEHVVSKSLGNDRKLGLVGREMVLPPGVVCDRPCNHERLSGGDKALAEWPPVSVFRSLLQVRNRNGRLINAVNGTEWSQNFDPGDPAHVDIHVVADTSDRAQLATVARALCKIAIETRYLLDPADAESERWDVIRAASIGGPLPSDITMHVDVNLRLDEIDPSPRIAGRLSSNDEPLILESRQWLVGLPIVLTTGAVDVSPASNWASWQMDDSGELAGPTNIWSHFVGRADTATPLAADVEPPELSDRDAIHLPTHSSSRLYLLASPRQANPHPDPPTSGA